jgi:hypothetical protein
VFRLTTIDSHLINAKTGIAPCFGPPSLLVAAFSSGYGEFATSDFFHLGPKASSKQFRLAQQFKKD